MWFAPGRLKWLSRGSRSVFSAEGKGLGSQFLRHIERTKVLVYLVECITEKIQENVKTLQKELKKHNPELIKRPSLLLLTKTDLIPEKLLKIGTISREIQIIQISSVTGKNLNKAIQSIATLIQSTTHVSKIPSD